MPHKHAPAHGVPDHDNGTSTQDHRNELTPRLVQLAAILGWGPRRFSDDEWEQMQALDALCGLRSDELPQVGHLGRAERGVDSVTREMGAA